LTAPNSSDSAASETPPVVLPYLLPGESVAAVVRSDVDGERRFRASYVVLTPQRLLSVAAETAEQNGAVSFALSDVAKLKTRDRAGLGTLEVIGADRRLAEWHYTFGQGPAVLVLMDRFEDFKAGRTEPAREADVEAPEAEVAEPPPSTMALFRLVEFVRPQAKWVALALALSLAAALGTIVPRGLSKPLVNGLTQFQEHGGEFPPVYLYLAYMLGAAMLAWLLGWGQGAILARVSERVSADLRTRTYAHLQRLSLEYFGGKRTGDLMSRLSTDSDRLCQFLSDNVVDFIADFLLIVGITIWLFWSNPALAAVSLAPFPFVMWLMYFARDRLQRGFLAGANAWSQMTSVLADTVPGIRVVKAFAQEGREIDRFRGANEHVVQTNNRTNSIWTFFWPLNAFVNNLGSLVVWAFGAYLIYQTQFGGEFTIGELTQFLMLSQLFYGRLEAMSRIVNQSQRAAASAQRIFEILDRVSSVPEPAKPVPLQRLKGELEFRNVGFRYGTRKVIRDLNLHIQPGEMIGLVGHTGAGKSTIVNLVCRFFDVAEGAIFADGVDIRSYTIADYRRNIGIVLQDPFLFYGTIAENIAYGRPNATRNEIIAAAKAAHAHQFILQLPDGYDSIVGERGQSLSGGERQRISIARAILISPSLLILDEATSSVDTKTEREIQRALHNLVQGRTTIAIAHRLSTLRQADRIVVIDRGRIVEMGTHDELLALDGHYAALHKAQLELTKDIGW
jgi:ATP-binding cassette subfamily B protein